MSAKRTAAGAEIHATVKNTSSREGDEVVQLYIGGGSDQDAPTRSLRGFERIHLRAGERRQVEFLLPAQGLPTAKVEISVGAGQPVGGAPYVKGSL